jgi:F-type H+-transporting ATPase subunit epsilon
VREGGQEKERLYVAGGFAEVGPERVTILADEATPVAELSRAEADSRIAAAEQEYLAAAAESPEKREAAMNRLLAMRAMREAAQAG